MGGLWASILIVMMRNSTEITIRRMTSIAGSVGSLLHGTMKGCVIGVQSKRGSYARHHKSNSSYCRSA